VRIASLVPHATELLFALGLADQVIAVTHECDYPPEALRLTHLTRDVLPAGLSAGEIDAAVRERTLSGQSIYELDEDALRELEPDLIVTQALCPVCAVSYEDVAQIAIEIPSKPEVISLDPHTFADTLSDTRTLAQATGTEERSRELIADITSRTDRVKLAVAGTERPRVAALEWFDPVYVAGHWTPELIDLAGGVDVLGTAGEHSRTFSWREVAEAEPQIVVAMPCGYDAPRAHRQALAHSERLRALGAERVVAVDASAYFSRPGPRLIDGLELLAHLFHPEHAPAPSGDALPVQLADAAAR